MSKYKLTTQEILLADLSVKLHETIMYLNKLQREHVKLTGKGFVISGPLKERLIEENYNDERSTMGELNTKEGHN